MLMIVKTTKQYRRKHPRRATLEVEGTQKKSRNWKFTQLCQTESKIFDTKLLLSQTVHKKTLQDKSTTTVNTRRNSKTESKHKLETTMQKPIMQTNISMLANDSSSSTKCFQVCFCHWLRGSILGFLPTCTL